MKKIKLTTLNAKKFIADDNFDNNKIKTEAAIKQLEEKNGAGSDYLGWLDLPYTNTASDISKFVDQFDSNIDTVVVIGIGGSYLGARAIISSLAKPFEKTKVEILYAGFNLNDDYHLGLIKYLENKNYAIIVISKSGTTTEPAIAFRFLRKHIENKFGKSEAAKRIIAITDKKRGALKQLADEEKYKSFVIPDDVGGRFSVLSPVGLLPIAFAGFDVNEIIKGARDLDKLTKSDVRFEDNIVLQYAAFRNALYDSGKKLEILTSYDSKLHYFVEWWKQLYGESEGKKGKGLFPVGVLNTTDLHSLGQYIQEGERHLFETVIDVCTPKEEMIIEKDDKNLDKLNYLAGKSLFEVNQKATEGTIEAHISGSVPNLKIDLPKINEYYLGQLIFFFEKACAVSGYMLGVNPFDQPGVEEYKKNMFRLLGK